VALTENGGGSAARNAGAARATGDYLVFLDGDDALAPWALEVYARLARQHRPAIMLASMFFFEGPSPAAGDVYWRGPDRVVDYDGRREAIRYVDYGTLLAKDRPFRSSGSSMVMEREAFRKAGGWTAEIFPGEDTDLQLKMLYDKPALHILAPPTAYYRMHDANTMKQIVRFTDGLRIVMRRARAGDYTRGRGPRRDSYSILGGEVWFWLQRARRGGQLGLAARLLVEGFPVIAVAIARRLATKAFGPLKAQTLPSLAWGAAGPAAVESPHSQDALRPLRRA